MTSIQVCTFYIDHGTYSIAIYKIKYTFYVQWPIKLLLYENNIKVNDITIKISAVR